MWALFASKLFTSIMLQAYFNLTIYKSISTLALKLKYQMLIKYQRLCKLDMQNQLLVSFFYQVIISKLQTRHFHNKKNIKVNETITLKTLNLKCI